MGMIRGPGVTGQTVCLRNANRIYIQLCHVDRDLGFNVNSSAELTC